MYIAKYAIAINEAVMQWVSELIARLQLSLVPEHE